MALKEHPYFPLYIQDFLTDEKLVECSAAATGVYIRLLCIMHKSEQYGKVLLGQKDKQNEKQILNFAIKLARQMPYHLDDILLGLEELISEKVVYIEGDFLCQKRMIRDNEISIIRSKTGKLGGDATKNKSKKFALAKSEANEEANTEYENETIVLDNKYNGVVIYNAEETILASPIDFERICMTTGNKPEDAKKSLRKYHLYLEEKEQYPKGRKAVLAGFEKWLMNETQFTKGKTIEPSSAYLSDLENKRKNFKPIDQ